MTDLRCRLGLHIFRWPPHRTPLRLWEDFHVECSRGCDARKMMRCYADDHWQEKHPVPDR